MSGLGTAEQIRSFFLEQIATQLAAAGISPNAVTDDFDLLSEGVVDSLGLLELIGAFEERFGVEVDMEGLSVDEITAVGPFCRSIERQLVSRQR